MNVVVRTLLAIGLAITIVVSFGASASADSGGAGADLCASQGAPLRDALICGWLPNGLRYIVQKNVTPHGTESIRLVIRAGSMQEAGDQHGIAHFLEHMVFRGSP